MVQHVTILAAFAVVKEKSKESLITICPQSWNTSSQGGKNDLGVFFLDNTKVQTSRLNRA